MSKDAMNMVGTFVGLIGIVLTIAFLPWEVLVFIFLAVGVLSIVF